MTKKRKIILAGVIILLVAAAIVAVTSFLGGRSSGIDNTPEQAVTGKSKALVAYFSWSGHGQQMARWISDETGADLFRIVPSKAYGKDFNECADRAKDELDNGTRPELAEHIDTQTMSQYDTIYLVFPVWWYDLPMPVWTFLEEYDLTGKTIIPCFSHNGSSSGANSVNRVSELAKGANVLTDKVLSISGKSVANSEKEVRDWADSVSGTLDTSEKNAKNTGTGNKILVVYYSASGNTKRVATEIANTLNADTFELVPKTAYTEDDLDWTADGSRVNKEHEDESLRDISLVKEKVENWDEYSTVLIGYPIWWGIAAWPVNRFVKNNDFTGKTVIPFATSASSGMGESGTLLEKMAGTGTWQEGQRFSSGASSDEVADWAKKYLQNYKER